MIVVVDTNVWISALQFAKYRGTPTLVLEKAMSEDVFATCDEIEAEIIRLLTEKFSWEHSRAVLALSTILTRSVRVQIKGTVKICRDPNDDMFLECAALANADLLGARRQGPIEPWQIPQNANHYALTVFELELKRPTPSHSCRILCRINR